MSTETLNIDNGVPGYFGKIPSHGDFLNRNLSRNFVDPWDHWLQHAITASRHTLAETWLETYLISPVWKFAIHGGVCGQNPVVGVLMPSVDKVGRYFPLTIACLLPTTCNVISFIQNHSEWFEGIEEVSLACLDDNFTLQDLDSALNVFAVEVATDNNGHSESAQQNWALSLTEASNPMGAIAGVAPRLLSRAFTHCCIWWSTGSDLVEPSLLISESMPEPDQYTGMLNGEWHRTGWGNPNMIRMSEGLIA